jgi:hypothetical protein
MNLKYNFSVHALRFAGQFPDICDILRPWRDNSTSKLQYTLFLKLGSHCNLSISIRFAFEIGVSLIKVLYKIHSSIYIVRRNHGYHNTLSFAG